LNLRGRARRELRNLVVGERPGLGEDGVRQRELADVVQERDLRCLALILLGQRELGGHGDGEIDDTEQVVLATKGDADSFDVAAGTRA